MSKDRYKESLRHCLWVNPSNTQIFGPDLLEAVPRSINRIPLGINDDIPFQEKIWNAYELSWLNKRKTHVAL